MSVRLVSVRFAPHSNSISKLKRDSRPQAWKGQALDAEHVGGMPRETFMYEQGGSKLCLIEFSRKVRVPYKEPIHSSIPEVERSKSRYRKLCAKHPIPSLFLAWVSPTGIVGHGFAHDTRDGLD